MCPRFYLTISALPVRPLPPPSPRTCAGGSDEGVGIELHSSVLPLQGSAGRSSRRDACTGCSICKRNVPLFRVAVYHLQTTSKTPHTHAVRLIWLVKLLLPDPYCPFPFARSSYRYPYLPWLSRGFKVSFNVFCCFVMRYYTLFKLLAAFLLNYLVY